MGDERGYLIKALRVLQEKSAEPRADQDGTAEVPGGFSVHRQEVKLLEELIKEQIGHENSDRTTSQIR